MASAVWRTDRDQAALSLLIIGTATGHGGLPTD
jgi:hypothetical protein